MEPFEQIEESTPVLAPLLFHVRPVLNLTTEQVFDLCAANRDWRIERNAQGDLIVMPPVGGETSGENAEITRQLGNWARKDGTGKVFDSSAGFILSNGAIRSPDASWVPSARLQGLSPAQRKKFLPLCPSFVIEIRSPSDALPPLRDKMQEYLANGAQLGWLLDPQHRRVHVYRPDHQPEVLDSPTTLKGDPELAGFVLELGEIWGPPVASH